MNLFFDEVVAFANKNPGLLELRALKSAEVQKFEISNVAAILPDPYAVSELPGLAPPYPNLWFEWVTEQNPLLKFGVFLASKKTEDGWNCTFLFFNGPSSKHSPVVFYPFGASCLIPPSGRYLEKTLVHCFLIPSMAKMRDSITDDMAISLSDKFLSLVFFALGLLHCKNIVLEERGGLNPQTKSRRHRSKGTRHHVLQIMPGRETKRRVYDQPGKGSPHSLHFRRGHFKEYTAENPLFGKYTGVFWWEAHVAGKPEIGTVTKDYQLLPPKNGLGAPAR